MTNKALCRGVERQVSELWLRWGQCRCLLPLMHQKCDINISGEICSLMTGEGDPVYKGECQVCLLHTSCYRATGNKLNKLQRVDKFLVRQHDGEKVSEYVNVQLDFFLNMVRHWDTVINYLLTKRFFSICSSSQYAFTKAFGDVGSVHLLHQYPHRRKPTEVNKKRALLRVFIL